MNCNGGPGALGELLICEVGTWVLLPADVFCGPESCEGLGFADPQVVGCVGQGLEWGCACAETPQGECGMGMQSECGDMVGDGVRVELCVTEGGKTWHYGAVCPGCELVDGEPLCTVP